MSLKWANEIFLGVVFCAFWVVQRGWQCVRKLNILNRQDSSCCSNHRGGLTQVGMEIILLPLDSQINVFLTNFSEVFGVKRHKSAGQKRALVEKNTRPMGARQKNTVLKNAG